MSGELLQLSDLIESYPDVDDQHFQSKITAKKEFAELSSNPTEKLPPIRGSLYKDQKLISRFLRVYDTLLLINEPGTGKSCSVLGFTEYALKQHDLYQTDPSKADPKVAHLRRAIILGKGKTHLTVLQNQLECACSDGRFDVGQVVDDTKRRTQLVQAAFRQAGYSFLTYQKFTKRILGYQVKDTDDKTKVKTIPPMTDAQIESEFSDTIFWIDEAHNISYDPLNPSISAAAKNRMAAFTRVFTAAKRWKLVLSSARPSLNRAAEIIPLQNLLLIPDGKSISVELFVKRKPTVQELRPFFSGRVSYVKMVTPGVQVEYPGQVYTVEYRTQDGEIHTTKVKMFGGVMSKFQTEAYHRARNGSISAAAHIQEIKASDFIYPDGYWGGGTTLEEALIKKKQKKLEKEQGRLFAIKEKPYRDMNRFIISPNSMKFQGSDELFKALAPTKNPRKNLEAISGYSIKFYNAGDAILGNIEQQGDGVIFILTGFIGGSALPLCVCLEALGLKRFEETQSIFSGTSRSKRSACISMVSGATVKPGFQYSDGVKTPYRYAIITGSTSFSSTQSILEAINSPENVEGRLIKVLVMSDVGRESVSVNNVVQEHFIEGDWNNSNLIQRDARGVRTGSHEQLIRFRASKGDLNPIKVQIYRHCAFPQDPISVDYFNIDMLMYTTINHKEENGVADLMDVLYKLSVTCLIHKPRNDPMNTYRCIDDPPTTVDISSYDIVYADEYINTVIATLEEILRKSGAINFENLVLKSATPKKYVIMALEKMITNKKPIRDLFGYIVYLREQGDIYYLSREYPTNKSDASLCYYANNLIAIEDQPIDSIYGLILNDKIRPQYQSVINNKDFNDKQKLEEHLESMTIDEQIIFLEQAVIDYTSGRTSTVVENIIDLYTRRLLLFKFKYPKTLIDKVIRFANIPGKKGRKREHKKIKKLDTQNMRIAEDEFFFEPTSQPEIYVHNMYSISQEKGTSYDLIPGFRNANGRLRRYNPGNSEWVDVNPTRNTTDIDENFYIEETISNIIQKRIDKSIHDRLESIMKKENLVNLQTDYGLLIDNNFYISRKSMDNIKIKDKTNGRTTNRGRICDEIRILGLINVLYNIGYPLPSKAAKTKDSSSRSRDDIKRILVLLKSEADNDDLKTIDQWDDDKILYHYAMLKYIKDTLSDKNDDKRGYICDKMIMPHMKEQGRVVNN